MKKKIIIICSLVFMFIVIAYTYSLPEFFSIKKINFNVDTKIEYLKSKLNSEYLIDEPVVLATENSKEMLDVGSKYLKIALGNPGEKIEHDLFNSKARFNELVKYYYTNDDLPKDSKGDIVENYKHYFYEGSKAEELEYYFRELEEINLIYYEEIAVVSTDTWLSTTPDDYELNYKLLNAKIKKDNEKTGKTEELIGTLPVTIRVRKSNEKYVLMRISVNDRYFLENSEIGNTFYPDNTVINKTDDEFSPEQEQIYQAFLEKYKKNVISLMLTNNKNSIVSNSTGIFIKDDIILVNWSWLEEYLRTKNNIVIADYLNNTYEIDGIITLSQYYDFVLLKLKDKAKFKINELKIGYSLEDALILSSPRGTGYNLTVTTTSNIVADDNYSIEILNAGITPGEVGSPVFNLEGRICGIISSKEVNNKLSSMSPLSKLSNVLIDIMFVKDFTIYKIEDVKKDLYFDSLNDLDINKASYDKKIYDKYMQNIDITEVYNDNISTIETNNNTLIVRVKYSEGNLLSQKQFTNVYTMKLIENGYKEVASNEYARIFDNGEYSVMLKYESQYISFIFKESQ